jgi:hypothetical protein
MTSAAGRRDAEFGARAADSAKCLLVIGGYRDYADILRPVVIAATEQILMSPSLGDFFELRFVDLGKESARTGDQSAAVARLVLELTSRPEAARNFSAFMLIDRSSAASDRLLRECQANRVLTALKVRFYGSATIEDRASGQDQGTGPEIDVAGRQRSDDVLTSEIVGYAERLLADFGSGWEPGVTVERVDELGVAAQTEHRGVVQAAARAEAEDRRKARRAEKPSEKTEREGEAEHERETPPKRTAEVPNGEGGLSRASEVGNNAESTHDDVLEVSTEVEPRQETERRAQDAQLRTVEARNRELEAQLKAERDRAERAEAVQAALVRQPEVERSPKSLSAEGGQEQPRVQASKQAVGMGAGTAESEASYGDSRTRHRGAGTEAARAEQLADESKAAPRKTVAALAGIAGSGVGLLTRKGRAKTEHQGGGARPGESTTLLLASLDRLENNDIQEFHACLRRLLACTEAGVSAEDRGRCRGIVIERGLFRASYLPGSLDIEFYDVLLRLVYGPPLSYPAYCEIEDLLNGADEAGRPPHRPLLEAIDASGPADDIRVTAITRYYLGRERLSEWFRSKQLNVAQLIAALAGEWERSQHAHSMYEVVIQYLNETGGPYQRHATRSALRAHGYLAAALRDLYRQSPGHQVTVLVAFLRAAYPAGLDRPAVTEIFAASELTKALARAVLRLLNPDDQVWAVRIFAERLGTRDIDAVQVARLLELLTSERS